MKEFLIVFAVLAVIFLSAYALWHKGLPDLFEETEFDGPID